MAVGALDIKAAYRQEHDTSGMCGSMSIRYRGCAALGACDIEGAFQQIHAHGEFEAVGALDIEGMRH